MPTAQTSLQLTICSMVYIIRGQHVLLMWRRWDRLLSAIFFAGSHFGADT